MIGGDRVDKRPDKNINRISQRSAHRARRDELRIPSDIYPVIDTDLARDNVENDLPAADRQDLM